MRTPLAGEELAIGASPFFCARESLDQASALTSHLASLSGMTIATYRRDLPNLGTTRANAPSATYLATVHLRELPSLGRWCDGSFQRQPVRHVGDLSCIDLRHRYVAEVTHPFHTFSVFVPQAAFDMLADEMGVPTITQLDPSGHAACQDGLMLNFARIMVPLLEQAEQHEKMLAEHMLEAIRLHLAVRYGGMSLPSPRQPASLAGWQMHKVKELMLDDLSADIGIEELARSCRLSASYFIRAFRGTVGVSPHRWRTYQRIEKSKGLLVQTDDPICAIALNCGFSGQSHFTRVFSAITYVSPGAYRRIHRSR